MHRSLLVALAGLVLFACSGQKEPAQKLLLDTDATIIAASAEAAKYVPQQLADVQRQYADLKASFDKQDYAGVMSTAPAVLGAAQTLATLAAARKDEVLKALNDDWTGLAAILPAEQSAIQNRLEELSQKANKKQAAGVDLDGSKASLRDAMSLWSKATAAFAAGNLDEAVATAKAVKAKLDPLAIALKVPVTGTSASAAAA
jgi:acetoin utilization deacetylase AcuC-like enzyme